MSPTALMPPLPGALPGATDSPNKIKDTASQFEALLIGQILRSVRESGGWLGTEDQTVSSAMEFAEQQFATLLAQQGGLGLATLIGQGLAHRPEADPAAPDAAAGTDAAGDTRVAPTAPAAHSSPASALSPL
jgi:peptidoglycan hydrolase FlgJ